MISEIIAWLLVVAFGVFVIAVMVTLGLLLIVGTLTMWKPATKKFVADEEAEKFIEADETEQIEEDMGIAGLPFDDFVEGESND